MARFQGANWRGSPNFSPNGMVMPIMGIILHIEVGTESAAINWFHNPASQASSHFGNPKTGTLDQFVDTKDRAWAEAAGNSRWLSIEHEGVPGDLITPNQIENDAQALAWGHQLYGFPLQITDNPNVPGIGWHGMGGLPWGGHLLCPGDSIKNARPAIIGRALQILGGNNTVTPAPLPPGPWILVKGFSPEQEYMTGLMKLATTNSGPYPIAMANVVAVDPTHLPATPPPWSISVGFQITHADGTPAFESIIGSDRQHTAFEVLKRFTGVS